VQVAEVDEEINQAVAALHHLLKKRSDLRSEQNRIHGTLFHRLPTELSNYIFELFLPLRTEWGEIRSPLNEATVMSPSYLASICRNWRETAWSNRSLWSSIQLFFEIGYSRCDQIDFLSFAKVYGFYLEEIVQLLLHAPQMTHCIIRARI
jgi:hypothetical protein